MTKNGRNAANFEWVSAKHLPQRPELSFWSHAAPGRWKNDGFGFLHHGGTRMVQLARSFDPSNLISQTAGFNDYDSIPNLDVVIAEGMYRNRHHLWKTTLTVKSS
jgi:hypothetical protein